MIPWINKYRKLVQIFILAIILVFYICMLYYLAQGQIVGDFAIFYGSAENYYQGKNIYDAIPIERYGEIPPEIKSIIKIDSFYPNLNPPFQTLLFSFFPVLNIQAAFFIWGILSILFGLISARIIDHSKTTTIRENSFLLAILLFAFFPTIAAIGEGQITLLILILLVIGWHASRRGNDFIAGIALGLALGLKLFIGLFLIYFLILRRYKLIGWCLVTFLATVLIPLFIFGTDSIRRYMEILGNVNWYSFSWNASLTGYFARIFEGFGGYTIFPQPGLTMIVSYSLSMLLLAIFIWAVWPKADMTGSLYIDLGFSLTMVLMLLISPFGWLYYFPFLILPMAIILTNTFQMHKQSIGYLAIVTWILMAFWPLLPHIQSQFTFIIFQLGFYTYALLVYSLLLVILLAGIKKGNSKPLEAPQLNAKPGD